MGNLIHWGTCCLPDADAPPRVSVGFNFMRKGERLQSGAPTLTREAVRGLGLPERLALIARSVLAYSPWYKLRGHRSAARVFSRRCGRRGGERVFRVLISTAMAEWPYAEVKRAPGFKTTHTQITHVFLSSLTDFVRAHWILERPCANSLLSLSPSFSTRPPDRPLSSPHPQNSLRQK